MKKNFLLVLSQIAVVFLLALSSYAQKQRLGIVPQEITLDGTKPTANVEAFCFDRHIVIDKAYDYKYLQTDESAVQVTVGDKSYSLPEAVSKKLIKVTGRVGSEGEPGLVIEMTRLVPETVTINVKKASVFRDTPGSYKNQQALDILNALKPSPNFITDENPGIQNSLWMADIARARLESLGYASVEEFQGKAGLSKTGGFDADTSAKLASEEQILIKRFEDAGLAAKRSDTPVQSVSDNIRFFESVSGLERTGVFSPKVRDLFAKFEPAAKKDFAAAKELLEFSRASDSVVLRISSSVGDDKLYTLHSPFGKMYEGNDIAEIKKMVSESVDDMNAAGKKLYLTFDVDSAEKAAALKTSLKINDLTILEASPEAEAAFFTSRQPVEIVSTTSPALRRGEWSQSIKLNSNQRVTAAAKLKRVVVKFVGTFRSLIGEGQSLAYIINESRIASGALRVSFTDQFGKTHIVKLFRSDSAPVITE